MPDLRTLTIEDRRRLAREAERRARDGMAPRDIRAELGLSRGAYTAWAKQYGFRQTDLRQETNQQEQGAIETLEEARTVLKAVRLALGAGDRSQADRLIAAWKASARRRRDFAALQAAAEQEQASDNESRMSNDELAAAVSALIGREVRLRG